MSAYQAHRKRMDAKFHLEALLSTMTSRQIIDLNLERLSQSYGVPLPEVTAIWEREKRARGIG